MPSLIAFHIYRTECLVLKGEEFTVTFTKRSDQEEYALFAVNAAGSKSWRAFYTPEVAIDFKGSTGRALEDEVYEVLKGDIESDEVSQETPSK
jgi:hypothetical protein